MLAHKLIGPFLLLPGLPLVLTTWTLSVIVARKWPARRRGLFIAAMLCLSCGAFLLLRAEGMEGGGQLALRWRWTLSPEQVYLTGPDATGATTARPARPGLSLHPGDWPGFRGPNRDGNLRNVRIATDWDAAPPKLLWKRRIGPAWSSVAIVGDRLFTQEQLGKKETVVCLHVADGPTPWSHPAGARREAVPAL